MKKNIVTANAAKEFWRDLMGMVYRGNWKGQTSGIMSAALIADYLCITPEKAEIFLRKCCELGLTERQSGCYVV